jgi:hypothetical protein
MGSLLIPRKWDQIWLQKHKIDGGDGEILDQVTNLVPNLFTSISIPGSEI